MKVWDWAGGTVRYALKSQSRNDAGLRPGPAPFSPDGATLAYVVDNTLDVVETVTGKVKQRTPLADWWYQVLSPSGRYLARYEARSDRDVPRSTFQVWGLAAGRQPFP